MLAGSGSLSLPPMRPPLHLLPIVLLSACGAGAPVGSPDAAGPLPFLDHRAWNPVGAEADAFPAHRPETVDCPEGGLYESLGVLEVEMNICNYVSVAQTLGQPAASGETLHFPLWHLQLFHPEPAEAHLALLVGGDLLVEYVAPIPSPAHIEMREVSLARDYPAGTMVQLHLHNHGENHWRIGPVELRR